MLGMFLDGAVRPGPSEEKSEDGFEFWGREGLSKVLQDQRVSIAVTPNG